MKYIKRILSNQMTVVLVPMSNTQILSAGFFVKAGSRDETDETHGIAHFLEHMMFKGTKTRTVKQLFNELDILGTVYNAATSVENTYYYVYGNAADTKNILDIVLDLYINPKFATPEINKERGVIMEEMRIHEDMPLMKLYRRLHKKMFNGTRLAKNIIGTEKTINGLQRSDFIRFRKKYYQPHRTVFIVVGKFNPGPIYNMIEKVLSDVPNSRTPADEIIGTYGNDKEIIMQNMDKQNEPYVFVKKNNAFKQIYVLLAFPLHDLYKSKSQDIDLLSQLLANGFSSRLNRSLRSQRGITYSTHAYPIVYSDSGIFLFQLIINPTEVIAGIDIVLKELQKLKKTLITDDELTKIVNVSKNEMIFSRDKPTDIMVYIGINLLTDPNFKPNNKKEMANLQQITKEDIRQIARDIFVWDKINLFLYGNTESLTAKDFSHLEL